MKQSLLISLIFCSGTVFAADKTFTGQIMDSQCADMGSHDDMMKGEHASNAKECALSCVKSGGTFALYDPAAKKAYKLDNQKKAKDFAGQKVAITGNYDSNSDSIHVSKIQAQ